MLAQDRGDGNDGTSHPAAKRHLKRPTKFMFIDSSNGGVNAKPDRVVRSFVMKSARNKKTWSTRPKSPKEEDRLEAQFEQQPSHQTTIQHKSTFASGSWSPLNHQTHNLPWDSHALVSPSSSRSDSVFSNHSGSRTCDSPSSSYTSPFAEHDCSEHAYSLPAGQQTTLIYRDGFDIGFAKPFDCLPVQLDHHARHLLHQFVEGSAPRLIPVDLHRSSTVAATNWISNSIQSPTGAPFIYAALTSSTRALGLASEAYKWRAISEVNKLLSCPSTSTDDTTIATVLVLLALEESDLADPRRQGSARESSLSANDAHLNGLRTMIGQRGGLAALNANRCLQVFILMHSTAQCITTFKRPYALLLDPQGRVDEYGKSLRRDSCWTPLPTPFLNLRLDNALLDIIHSVHLFSSDLATWYDGKYTLHPLDPFELQKHACLLTYRLFDWYQCGEESEFAGTSARNPIDQSVCLAHLIFLVVATEPCAQSLGSRLSKVVVKLRQALQRVSILHWTAVPELFLWTLTMGALGAKGLPRSQQSCASEFAFFVQYSQLSFASSKHSGSQTAEDLLRRVQHCPWIPLVFDMRAKRMWARMGLCRASVVDVEESSSEDGEFAVDDEYALGQSTTARFFPALKAGLKKVSPR